jgi:hypothetical protein
MRTKKMTCRGRNDTAQRLLMALAQFCPMRQLHMRTGERSRQVGSLWTSCGGSGPVNALDDDPSAAPARCRQEAAEEDQRESRQTPRFARQQLNHSCGHCGGTDVPRMQEQAAREDGAVGGVGLHDGSPFVFVYG